MKRKMFFILGILTLSLVACKKEGCTDSTASNYDSKAKKNDGTCTYFVDNRDQYLGSYDVRDSVYTPGPNGGSWQVKNPYVVQFTKGTAKGDTIFMYNVGNHGITKTASLQGKNFVLFSQSGGSNIVSTGNGAFDGNKVTYSFDSYIPGNPDTYGKGTKQ